MDGDERGRGVRLFSQQLQELEVGVLFRQDLPGLSKILLQGFVLFLHGEAPHTGEVFVLHAQLFPGLVAPPELLQAGKDLARRVLVQPEIGLSGLLLDLRDLPGQRFRVKDPSRFPGSALRGW